MWITRGNVTVIQHIFEKLSHAQPVVQNFMKTLQTVQSLFLRHRLTAGRSLHIEVYFLTS